MVLMLKLGAGVKVMMMEVTLPSRWTDEGGFSEGNDGDQLRMGMFAAVLFGARRW